MRMSHEDVVSNEVWEDLKHLDVRNCWLQEELQNGTYSVKRVDRKFNASDMLSHCPSAEELRKFLPMFGCHTKTVTKENVHSVELVLKEMLAAEVTVFFARLAETLNS